MTQPESKIHLLMDQLTMKNPFHDGTYDAIEDENDERLLDPCPPGIEPVPRVSTKSINWHAPSALQLQAVQRLLCALEYNHLPTTFFNLKKNRPLSRLIATAKEILADSLPIRCLEATFVAIHLTQTMKDVERIPLAFKSYCAGKYYRHIVLVVCHEGAYGALGLSRKSDLMDKPLCFRSLGDLLDEYMASYRNNGHELASFKLGLHVSHESTSRSIPCFRFMTLKVKKGIESIHNDSNVANVLLRFQELLPTLSKHYEISPTEKTMALSPLNPPPAKLDPHFSDDDDDDSDTEENRHRVQCVSQGKSPYQPSALATNGVAGSKFASRLRSQLAAGNAVSAGDLNRGQALEPKPTPAGPSGAKGRVVYGRRGVSSCPPRARNAPLDPSQGGKIKL